MTTTLDTMQAAYVTALGEADVDFRILNYVDALIHALDTEKENSYNLKCKLEDAELQIHEMQEEAK